MGKLYLVLRSILWRSSSKEKLKQTDLSKKVHIATLFILSTAKIISCVL